MAMNRLTSNVPKWSILEMAVVPTTVVLEAVGLVGSTLVAVRKIPLGGRYLGPDGGE